MKGYGSKATAVPLFLNREDTSNIEVLLDFLKTNVGQKKNEIDFGSLNSLFSDASVTKALITSALRCFSFEAPSMPEGTINQLEKKQKQKRKTGLSDFLEQEEIFDISRMSAGEIREIIFSEVNKRYPGYVPSDEREKFLADIARTLSVKPSIVEKIMYLDLESEKILQQTCDLSALELIGYYNYDLIYTLLAMSQEVEIDISDLSGGATKKLIVLSKVNYIFTEIQKQPWGYKLIIEPPLELINKGKWGENIAKVATYIIRYAVENEVNFKLRAILLYRNRKVLFQINSENLPLLPKYSKEEFIVEKPEIDSKIEARFYKDWKTMQGWQAIPEPEPIIVGNKVIIPDFKLKRGKTEVFVEIVGYYTQQYIKKKKNIMALLAKNNVPIIYLIDEQLRPQFVDIRNITAVYYSKNEVPNRDLLKLLDEKYTDYEERVPILVDKLNNICQVLEQQHVLTLQQIEEKINVYSRNELLRILETKEAQETLEKNNIAYVKNFGLVHIHAIEKIKKFVLDKKKVEFAELKKQFPEYGEAIIQICQFIGAKLKWKSFQDILILAPRKPKKQIENNEN